MREALAAALSVCNLDEQEARERPVDRLHALAFIQTPVAHDLDKAEWAREASLLCSLGVDLYRFKGANDSRAYKPCIEALAAILGWKRHRLDLKWSNRQLVARQALVEFVIDFCPTCSGRGEIPAQEGLDGAQRMKECPDCHGTGIRKYTNDERRSCFINNTVPYERLERALMTAHGIMGHAVMEVSRNYFRTR